MNRRTLLAGVAALAATPAVAFAQAKTKLVFWHAMTARARWRLLRAHGFRVKLSHWSVAVSVTFKAANDSLLGLLQSGYAAVGCYWPPCPRWVIIGVGGNHAQFRH